MFERLWTRRKVENQVKPLLIRHMGGPCDKAQTISHVIKPIEHVSLQLALDRWFDTDQGSAQLIGYSASVFSRANGLGQLLHDKETALAPVERQQFSRGPGEELDCVTRGIYLLHHKGRPVVVLLRHSDRTFDQPTLELMAAERQTAQAAMSELLAEVKRHTAYRGKTIYLEEENYPREVHLRFRELAPVARERIVLPDAVMGVVERNVLGLIKHRELLRRAGRPTRHGLLFHGPPGTGKTLMLRYLAHACPGHTVILLTGRQMGLIRESCDVARLLAPALVVMEDVDLVAGERSNNKAPTLLHELMDEMDGLGTRADCIFLLTTNRPEVLEPALAARPGRIDQAVEFPLPDEKCRRRLLAVYAGGLNLDRLDLDRWVEKTEGVSPAFIEQLLRRASLMAAERGENAVPLSLQDEDMERALEDLVYFGGELTQRLLGYRTIGFRTPGPRA
jgi:hypothetical protein